jgi:hypothetical protein
LSFLSPRNQSTNGLAYSLLFGLIALLVNPGAVDRVTNPSRILDGRDVVRHQNQRIFLQSTTHPPCVLDFWKEPKLLIVLSNAA